MGEELRHLDAHQLIGLWQVVVPKSLREAGRLPWRCELRAFWQLKNVVSAEERGFIGVSIGGMLKTSDDAAMTV